jgi:adenine-specific DNA-methyltransferase
MPALNFKGKSIVRTHHLTVPYRQLKPNAKKSLTKGKPNLSDNLIVHGDNLLALKALLPSFSGKIKCIYIDPPYNTGNENWVYNDNVNSPMHAAWLKSVVDKEDLTRHDKWLCMMWPRLVLLRELLREDGVIFISIDDNEVHHLRAVMDEIFGEGNFVGKFIWRKKEGGGQTDAYFVTEHEYILVYAKSNQFRWIDETIPLEEGKFNKADEKGKFAAVKLAKWGSGARREDRPKMYFPIKSPDDKNIYPRTPDGREGRWRVGKIRMDFLIENELVYWEKRNGEWVAYEKIYYDEDTVRKLKERSILFDLATTGDASNELKDLFGVKGVFDNPKPSELIKFLITYTTDKDSILLDSFAGSGTTAHAVLALNAEDGGNRKFILVEQEEYADTITAERVRRVMRGVPNAKDEALQKGYGGTFSFFTLGPALDDAAVLSGKEMPSYLDLARYVFFTATGEQLEEAQVNEARYYLGESRQYVVYLLYQPSVDFLKNTPLNLSFAQALLKSDKPRLVIASHKYLDDDRLREMRIEFCQLPFAIYRFRAQ